MQIVSLLQLELDKFKILSFKKVKIRIEDQGNLTPVDLSYLKQVASNNQPTLFQSLVSERRILELGLVLHGRDAGSNQVDLLPVFRLPFVEQLDLV